MKTTLPTLLLGTFALLAATIVNPARAGSVVVTDGYGAAGWAYGGGRSLAQLQRKAFENCRENTEHPDNLHVYVTNNDTGYGIVVRCRVKGEQRVIAIAGCGTAKEAYDRCMKTVDDLDGKKVEVLGRWSDEG